METEKVNTVFQWEYLSLLIQLHPHRSKEHSYVLQALFQILLIIDLLVNSVTVWDEPDGWYKITSVYNLTSNKTKTFRCSDLSGQAPPKRKAAEKAAFLFAIIKENRRER